MAAPWLDELNPAQRQAATYGDGPVLVIAGAGTGKTKTLACRVAHLIGRGMVPERLLLLTFTRRAAAEALARAERLTGGGLTGRVWGGTFHATANRLLRQYGRALGLAPEFTVMDQADAADLMNLIRSELGLAKTHRRFPRKATLSAIYSRVVNSRTKLAEILEKHYPWCQDDLEGIRAVFEQFTQRKRQQNVLDYDDLLLYWNAVANLPGTGEAVADRFDHILVDEYQDTNLIQAEILRGLRRRNRNIMVVGDDAQSIYSFRAATVTNILDFPTQFPGAAVIKLEQNYRSLQPILDTSNRVMAQAEHQFAKNLVSTRSLQEATPTGLKPALVTCMDEPAQCAAVCTRILEALERNIPLKRQAVLFRAGHHSDQLEVELTRRNIPFVKYGGLKFVEAAHIKDVLALLRLMENPGDEISWFRVLLLLEGVGPASARRIMNALRGPTIPDTPDVPAAAILRLPHPGMIPAAVPGGAHGEFAELCQVFADCGAVGDTAKASLPPAAQVERIRRFYEPIFRRQYDNPETRLRDLDQLEQIAGNYKSRGSFITDLTLDPPSSTQDLAGPPLLEEDYLILSTIHSAKGCEWDEVHIIHAADGMIPSDMATGSPQEIDEERRLLYVAMTRARDRLYIYFPLRYYFRKRASDRHSYAQLTRFIPPAALSLFDRISVGVAGEDSPQGPDIVTSPAAAQAIHRMLHDLWQ